VAGVTLRCYITIPLHPGVPLRPVRFLRHKDALRTLEDSFSRGFSVLISKPLTDDEFKAVSLHDGDCCRCRRYEPWVEPFPAPPSISWCDCAFDIYGFALDPSNCITDNPLDDDDCDIPF
jgi:hypothetical protein